ncbi:MAG: hypothetical protein QHH09_02955 [Microgenomates group bacterium]|nr:hypothetical protein [Microgenomates group bacterium]
MPLPLFSLKKRQELYFGLFLKEDQGIAFIFEEKGGRLNILNKEKFRYSNGWENLIDDVDEVIFRMEKETKTHLEKTIIFIYSHLVDDKTKEIKRPYLNIIKDLFKNLELKPLGYIETYQGVVDYLEKEEKMALTAIVIELDKTNLSVFIYKVGKKVFSQSVGRTDQLIEDLLEVFEKIKGTILLPSRIILYNSTDLDSASTEILAYRWPNDLFLHLPRVEIISEEKLCQSLISVFEDQIKQEEEPDSVSIEPKKEVLGFVVGGDITDKQKEEVAEIVSQKPKFKIPINFGLLMNKLNFFSIKKIKINLPKFQKLFWFIGLGLIAFSLFLTEFYFHRANLVVYLPTKKISQTINYDFDLSSPKGEEFRIQVATISGEFDQNKTVTGKKEIGEKAKGEVVFHNFSDLEKTFNRGTILETKGIKFVLEEDVKVASASVLSDNSAKIPGKAKGKVTANEIGPEGNLLKGQKFTIDNLSPNTYFAINENSFGGGNKKEVKTVAKADLEDLEKSILSLAKKQLDEKIVSQLNNKEKYIKELTNYQFKETNYSKEIGEEASEINLKAKITGSYYYYNQDEWLTFLTKSLSKNIDTDFSLDRKKINYQWKKASLKDNKITLEADVSATLMKKVDEKRILNSLIGKNVALLDKLLKSDFGALGYEINIDPQWVLIKNYLPFFKKNINLKFSNL